MRTPENRKFLNYVGLDKSLQKKLCGQNKLYIPRKISQVDFQNFTPFYECSKQSELIANESSSQTRALHKIIIT